MNIIGFAGSNSSTSRNKKLVNVVLNHLDEDHNVELLDLNDYEMPLYGVDLESASGIPEKAHNFAKKIDESDFLVVSFAEHNGTFTVAFKNVLDWISRIPNRSIWGDKPVFFMATSPGQRGGASVLETALKIWPFRGAKVMGSYSLPSFDENYDEDMLSLKAPYDKELTEVITKALAEL